MSTTKLFKISTLLILTTIFLTQSLFAQPERRQRRIPDSEGIEKMVNKMADELSLNEMQHEKILDLYIAHFDEMRKLRDDKKEERKLEREEMRENRERLEEEVKANLTEDQQEQFDEYMDKQKKKRRNRKGRGK